MEDFLSGVVGPTQSCWLFQGFSLRARASLQDLCGSIPSCPFLALSPCFCAWRSTEESHWQLCVWRRCTKVQVVGRRLGSFAKGESCTQTKTFSWRAAAQKRNQIRATCRQNGLLLPVWTPEWRACEKEVQTALFSPWCLSLSAFSMKRYHCGLCAAALQQ